MKKAKKDIASFQTLDAAQMKKIDGGQWVEITTSDGKKTTIWI